MPGSYIGFTPSQQQNVGATKPTKRPHFRLSTMYHLDDNRLLHGFCFDEPLQKTLWKRFPFLVAVVVVEMCYDAIAGSYDLSLSIKFHQELAKILARTENKNTVHILFARIPTFISVAVLNFLFVPCRF